MDYQFLGKQLIPWPVEVGGHNQIPRLESRSDELNCLVVSMVMGLPQNRWFISMHKGKSH